MDLGFIARRIVHISAPLFLLYYFVPSPVWEGGPTREVALLGVLIVTMLFELSRLVLGFRVPGMREYEADQISAGAWAAIGLTVAFLLFPLSIVAPVVIGMALVDPLISKVRRTKWYPAMPILVYAIIMVGWFALTADLDIRTLVAAAVTSVIAIASEGIKTPYVDDDFLMIVVPLIGLSFLL